MVDIDDGVTAREGLEGNGVVVVVRSDDSAATAGEDAKTIDDDVGGFFVPCFEMLPIVLVNVRAKRCPSFDSDELRADFRTLSLVRTTGAGGRRELNAFDMAESWRSEGMDDKNGDVKMDLF